MVRHSVIHIPAWITLDRRLGVLGSVIGIHAGACRAQEHPSQRDIPKTEPQSRVDALRPHGPPMCIHAAQIQDHHQHSARHKQRPKHPRERAEQWPNWARLEPRVHVPSGELLFILPGEVHDPVGLPGPSAIHRECLFPLNRPRSWSSEHGTMGHRWACVAMWPLITTEVDAGLRRHWSLERGVERQNSGRRVQVDQ
jgi:hypothetical protein